MKAAIPYGSDRIEIENDNIKAVFDSKIEELKQEKSEDEIVLDAMKHPIGTPTLYEMALGKKTATIIISDHTRPVPSKHIIPFMLEELRRANPDMEICFLVATGCHRSTQVDELIGKLGEDIVRNEKIIVHDCDKKEDLVNIGVLPSGANLIVNKYAVEADLTIAEGFIEPHFFAGYSGGRKSILPGVCSRKTVLGNHCSKFIDSPYAVAGVLDANPIHRDMIAAARMANLQYIVNVIINDDKKVVAAFAGDAIDAHRAGCDYLGRYCKVKIDKKRDIVITSNGGYPVDQNLYQAVKGISTAMLAAKPGGVIIMCAECRDGIGGDVFYRKVKECPTIDDLIEEILATEMDDTVPDQWQYQILANAIKKFKLIVVTNPELKQVIADMKMTYAPSLEEAVKMAGDFLGREAEISVITNGISTIIESE